MKSNNYTNNFIKLDEWGLKESEAASQPVQIEPPRVSPRVYPRSAGLPQINKPKTQRASLQRPKAFGIARNQQTNQSNQQHSWRDVLALCPKKDSHSTLPNPPIKIEVVRRNFGRVRICSSQCYSQYWLAADCCTTAAEEIEQFIESSGFSKETLGVQGAQPEQRREDGALRAEGERRFGWNNK